MRRRRRWGRRRVARVDFAGSGLGSGLGSLRGGTRGRKSGLGIALALVMGLAFVGFQYCSAEGQVVPITGREQKVSLSDDQQMQLGVQYYDEFLQQSAGRIVDSGPQWEAVREVTGRIVAAAAEHKPEFEWEVTLIDDPQANAFCLPGGKMVVYSGILGPARDAEGLATVIGHEVAHAVAEHGAERIFRQQLTDTAVQFAAGAFADDPVEFRNIAGLLGAGAQVGLSLPWSREQESEADRIGLIYMARAGYDPRAAVGFWERMDEAAEGRERPPEYLSTHPESATRIEQIRGWLPEALEEYRA
ncbi:MAG TPA: M48 family metallopeptidase [Actinomycetota bacterium]|nr:M48 family metallopeptidase [Actinomycetota bacterium]